MPCLFRSKWAKNEEGVTAVEFALVGLPFLIMVIGIIVVAMEDFGEAEDFPPASFDADGDLEDQGFDPGGVSDVVMIRTAYTYPIKTPMMQVVLTNNGGTSRIMLSTVVLQTEPYEFEDE